MLILIISAVVLVLLLFVAISLLKKQSKRKKLLKYFQEEYLKILRVDALDRAIVSPTDLALLKTGPRKILVQVHETSELTDKTYLLDVEQPWYVGRKPGPNTICIRGDKTVSSVHCAIQAKEDRVFITDMGSKNLTYYQPRKGSKQAWHLPQRGSQMLTTGDKFFVGYTCFEVTIYHSNYGII